jgi:hypothetical protein
MVHPEILRLARNILIPLARIAKRNQSFHPRWINAAEVLD